MPLPPAEVSNVSSIPENGDVPEIAEGQPQFSGVSFFATTPTLPRNRELILPIRELVFPDQA
jgi:hypothetical protein